MGVCFFAGSDGVGVVFRFLLSNGVVCSVSCMVSLPLGLGGVLGFCSVRFGAGLVLDSYWLACMRFCVSCMSVGLGGVFAGVRV